MTVKGVFDYHVALLLPKDNPKKLKFFKFHHFKIAREEIQLDKYFRVLMRNNCLKIKSLMKNILIIFVDITSR